MARYGQVFTSARGKTVAREVMPRSPCDSKTHFAKCVTNVEGRPVKITWKCDHCGKHVISGEKFKPAYARVHLAAESNNGLCSILCDATDDHATSRRAKFRKQIKELREKKAKESRKRKQQQMRLQEREKDAHNVKKMRQPKIATQLKLKDCDAADMAVAQWAIAHDIPANALRGVYWKQLNVKLSQVGPSYKPMNHIKLKKDLLPVLRAMAKTEQQKHLSHRIEAGRTLTGDGATKSSSPLINFLVHVPGKGVTLLAVTDCSDHMSSGGIKDSLYVANMHACNTHAL